jgi:hypothetical protein
VKKIIDLVCLPFLILYVVVIVLIAEWIGDDLI